MTSLSITLPDTIARASNEAAKKLGISRTEFIRQAIIHELNNFQLQAEQVAIVKSFTAMKKSKEYIEEMVEITETLNSELPQEGKKWWNKEKY
ncbi:MAG: ribbon-helix-helix domain-containing protein [Rickettsia endosymbiont of Pseudomimeciton antennatum]|nr:ribbon-helix-helix domain-containing protein [Rickettsia endosymbiont of Pseudomimeciton antennatum]MCC8398059.1 ribbon-helix-helix domain-containing protein [Rickettsia endosymbiont of Labidopullus appendiculatus]